jgi:hypothetical protein
MYIEQQRIRKHSDFMMQVVSHNVYARAVNNRCNLIRHRVEHQYHFNRNLLRPSSLLIVYSNILFTSQMCEEENRLSKVPAVIGRE